MAVKTITLADALARIHDRALIEQSLRPLGVMQLMALKIDADSHINDEPKLLRLMGDIKTKFNIRIPQKDVLTTLTAFSTLSEQLILEKSKV